MFDGPEPIYLQIADHLRGRILDGSLKEGDQVMSTTQFATTYRINPATAAKGLGLLVDEGLVEKRRGLGMYVDQGAREALLKNEREHFLREEWPVLRDRLRRLGLDLAMLAKMDTTGEPKQ